MKRSQPRHCNKCPHGPASEHDWCVVCLRDEVKELRTIARAALNVAEEENWLVATVATKHIPTSKLIPCFKLARLLGKYFPDAIAKYFKTDYTEHYETADPTASYRGFDLMSLLKQYRGHPRKANE